MHNTTHQGYPCYDLFYLQTWRAQGNAAQTVNASLPKTGKRPRPVWVLPVIIITVLTVIGVTVGLVLFYVLADSTTFIASTATFTAATTVAITTPAVPTCISCDSTSDSSCSETSAPTTTTPCGDGICYLQKDISTTAITRGCITTADVTTIRMLVPPRDSGQTYCATKPAGDATGPIICVCNAENCNDASNTYTVMGGVSLEGLGSALYRLIFTCTYPNPHCVSQCYMANTKIVRGCGDACACL